MNVAALCMTNTGGVQTPLTTWTVTRTHRVSREQGIRHPPAKTLVDRHCALEVAQRMILVQRASLRMLAARAHGSLVTRRSPAVDRYSGYSRAAANTRTKACTTEALTTTLLIATRHALLSSTESTVSRLPHATTSCCFHCSFQK